MPNPTLHPLTLPHLVMYPDPFPSLAPCTAVQGIRILLRPGLWVSSSTGVAALHNIAVNEPLSIRRLELKRCWHVLQGRSPGATVISPSGLLGAVQSPSAQRLQHAVSGGASSPTAFQASLASAALAQEPTTPATATADQAWIYVN